jgi:tetratricopeptide (TPR) repeat protein
MKNLDSESDDDDKAELQRHIGIIWMKREKYEEALSMFEEALKIKVPLSSVDSSEKTHRHLVECFDGALESVAIVFGSDHLRYAKVSCYTNK